MKKPLLTLILCIVALGVGYAQFSDGTVLQPTSVTARRFDASGQLIKELNSTYTYDENGKLIRYDLPGHVLWSTYSYDDNMLRLEYTHHEGGHPLYYETFEYSYDDNNLMRTKAHNWGQLNAPESWIYYYDDHNRLERVDYSYGYSVVYDMHYLYEYEDEGRTMIECYWTSYASQGMKLRERTVYHYDDAFNLLDKTTEKFSVEGELTQATQSTYTYTPSGKEESEVMQTLTEGAWANTGIIRYVYDDNNRVMEWQVGTWSEETGDWELTKRATYELNEEELTYTVSFYKKDGEEWGWDAYYFYLDEAQPVFFEPYLQEPEHALRFYGYDDLYDCEYIGQFIFTLVETNEPTYESAKENQEQANYIYPNPGNDKVRIESPFENAVVRFYDLQGRLVAARLFNFSTDITTENWPAGIYVWEIWHNNQKAASGKWMKE